MSKPREIPTLDTVRERVAEMLADDGCLPDYCFISGGDVIAVLTAYDQAVEEGKKDYADMRKFQSLYIASDQECRKLREALVLAVELIENAPYSIPDWGKKEDRLYKMLADFGLLEGK